jgi:hypothetical protein
MAHWKSFLDPSDFIGPQDFPTDKTVKISRIVREKMPSREGEGASDEKSAAMIYFSAGNPPVELKRKYKVAKSVKDITLFATKCTSFGETEECVRIRFAPDVDKKIFKWLKKRKSPQSAYMIGGAA